MWCSTCSCKHAQHRLSVALSESLAGYLYHAIPRLDVCKSKAKMGSCEGVWRGGGAPRLFKWHHVIWIPVFFLLLLFLFLTQNFFFPFWLRRRIIGTPSLPPPPGQAAQDLGRFTSANTSGWTAEEEPGPRSEKKGPFVQGGAADKAAAAETHYINNRKSG